MITPLQLHRPPLGGICWGILFACLTCVLPTAAFGDEALDHFNKANELIQQGQHTQAMAALQKSIDAYPKFAEAHHLLGLVYFTGLKEPQKALAALKSAVTHYPNFARAQFDLGAVLQHVGKFDDAELAYKQAATLYPRFEEAQLALANLYDQTKQSQKAIQTFTKVLALNPDHPEGLYKLAFWHRQAGKIQQASTLLDRLHSVKPTHLGGWLLRGDIAEHATNDTDAIAAYEKALAINNELLAPHDALGFLYQNQGKSQKAAKHFRKVITLAPQNPEAHLNLGVVLASLKQLDEAEQQYLSALQLNPALTDAYYNLGVFYEFHRNDTTKALIQYREYLKRGGTDSRIAKLIQKVEK